MINIESEIQTRGGVSIGVDQTYNSSEYTKNLELFAHSQYQFEMTYLIIAYLSKITHDPTSYIF